MASKEFMMKRRKPHYKRKNERLPKMAKCLGVNSIPVRVTIEVAHKWLNEAIYELFIFHIKPFCSLFVLYLRESLSSTVFRIFIPVKIQCVRYSFGDLCTRFLKHVAIHIARGRNDRMT